MMLCIYYLFLKVLLFAPFLSINGQRLPEKFLCHGARSKSIHLLQGESGTLEHTKLISLYDGHKCSITLKQLKPFSFVYVPGVDADVQPEGSSCGYYPRIYFGKQAYCVTGLDSTDTLVIPLNNTAILEVSVVSTDLSLSINYYSIENHTGAGKTLDFGDTNIGKLTGLLYGNLPLNGTQRELSRVRYMLTTLPKPAYVRFDLLHIRLEANSIMLDQEKLQGNEQRGSNWVIPSDMGQMTVGYETKDRSKTKGKFAIIFTVLHCDSLPFKEHSIARPTTDVIYFIESSYGHTCIRGFKKDSERLTCQFNGETNKAEWVGLKDACKTASPCTADEFDQSKIVAPPGSGSWYPGYSFIPNCRRGYKLTKNATRLLTCKTENGIGIWDEDADSSCEADLNDSALRTGVIATIVLLLTVGVVETLVVYQTYNTTLLVEGQFVRWIANRTLDPEALKEQLKMQPQLSVGEEKQKTKQAIPSEKEMARISEDELNENSRNSIFKAKDGSAQRNQAPRPKSRKSKSGESFPSQNTPGLPLTTKKSKPKHNLSGEKLPKES